MALNTIFSASRVPRPLLHLAIVALTLSCSGTARSDVDARRRALQAFVADPVLRQLPLDVRVDHGIARLSGEIGTRDEERRALEAVSRTAGVVGVINGLTFSKQRIVEHVREALGSDRLVAQVPVTITVNGGEVTLRSNQTDSEQRRRMVAIVAAVDGVVHVVDEMK